MPRVEAAVCVVASCREPSWPLATSQLCEKHLKAWTNFVQRWTVGSHLVANDHTLKAVAQFHKTGKVPPHRTGK